MEGATLTRRTRPRALAHGRAADPAFLARAAFALLCLGTAIGFFLYPTYPNYDSYYSLLWGREVLDFSAPTFEGFRVPTEHPLAIVAGALLGLAGDVGDRLWIAMTLAAYLWLVAGVYRLGRVAFTPLVGAAAAALLLTRFDFAFLAVRGYIDIPYMAIVVWAAALEAVRPPVPDDGEAVKLVRRGTPVLLLLAAAGLLRPEAWVLAGLYWCFVAWRATWRERALYAALAAIGPVLWAATDWAVTGDPLFSLHYTSSSAEDLGRQLPVSELPSAIPDFFASLVKLPVVVAAIVGFGIAVLAAPRRAAAPFALLAAGVATFVLIGIAGASAIERYLAIAAVALLVFAGVALGGFSMLEAGTRLRRAWMAAVLVLVVVGTVFTLTRVDFNRFGAELEFRGRAHDDLSAVLNDPRVQAGLRCGPLTFPNHKLLPDARWIADLPFEKVLARVDPDVRPQRRGVAIYVTGRFAIFKHALTSPSDSALVEVPQAGYERVKATPYYVAYVSC
jgi:hypothetical protein